MLLEKLSTSRTENFNLSRISGIGSLGPKIGYFHIKAIEFRTAGKFTPTPIAIGYWKKTKQEAFYTGEVVEMALKSLFNRYLLNSEEIAKYVGSTLRITEVNISYGVENGEATKIAETQWYEDLESSPFIDRINVDLFAFFGNATYLSEAWTNLESSINMNLTDYLFDEAEVNEIIEDVQDDFPVEEVPDNIN